MTPVASPEDVHRFWFADTIHDPEAASVRGRLWFGSAQEFDEQIRLRFGATLRAAKLGELSGWEDAPFSCVALVIVLDQFPRNAYRNTAAAFASDHLALGVAQRAIAAGYPADLSVPERAFLLMPYQHVEDAALQRESVRLFQQVASSAPPEWHAFAENSLQFARRHLEIIERFGRFPYRNAVLGRPSTSAELDYLGTKPETFGQGG